jgi:hypothetical protein
VRCVCLVVVADVGKIVLSPLKTVGRMHHFGIVLRVKCQGSCWLGLLGKTRTVSDFTYRLLGQLWLVLYGIRQTYQSSIELGRFPTLTLRNSNIQLFFHLSATVITRINNFHLLALRI